MEAEMTLRSQAAMKGIGPLTIALTLCGQAWARPWEDASATYMHGDYAAATGLRLSHEALAAPGRKSLKASSSHAIERSKLRTSS